MEIPTGENHIPIPMGMGIHMVISVWGSIWDIIWISVWGIHVDPHTHGIGNMIFSCGDPHMDSVWGFPQKSCGNGMGMGMEIPFPRQPDIYPYKVFR